MSRSPEPKTGPRQAVLDALKAATSQAPLDAYQVAKATGVSPMQAGRTMLKLLAEGLASTQDPLGTENDLAARFTLSAS